MARCGWCSTSNLNKQSNGDGQGLESHNLPNSRRKCEGPGTSPYASRITSRTPRPQLK